MLAYAFKTHWYPNFTPSCHVTKVRLFAWRILVLDPGSQQLILQRLIDGKEKTIKAKSFSNQDLLCTEDCIQKMQLLGFSLQSREPHELVFSEEIYKASST